MFGEFAHGYLFLSAFARERNCLGGDRTRMRFSFVGLGLLLLHTVLDAFALALQVATSLIPVSLWLGSGAASIKNLRILYCKRTNFRGHNISWVKFSRG